MHKPINPRKWLRDDQGVTSIEYALLGSLIAIVILGSVVALGSGVKSLYEMIAAAIP
ncbi:MULTISPECIES: Flp family type IVb pilin [Ralstonia]|jgi:pilus assembly protein Flp/PilA|uniref:Flp/Fap pilin component n=3 Tax=Ralstonia TaxID=48736 RepID=A0AAD2F0Z9_9RALS|nr:MULTISPECIES: Flp family type IVb pilin [Ralstonia]MEA3271369.1 Flp family type IVb pilin [Pseudomonadota bacterium]ENZ78475.1 Flp pilus assembly protein, pilin Flp [Ralstonia pickettii OR214]KHK48871.1 pilus assembly protein [Ralstonia sp. A12]MBL4778011.1 Flp family type IVb pilin [Ralstonia sp.]MBT2179201.1 Flp family type IVb pilin [Ralstonia pickettii]